MYVFHYTITSWHRVKWSVISCRTKHVRKKWKHIYTKMLQFLRNDVTRLILEYIVNSRLDHIIHIMFIYITYDHIYFVCIFSYYSYYALIHNLGYAIFNFQIGVKILIHIYFWLHYWINIINIIDIKIIRKLGHHTIR